MSKSTLDSVWATSEDRETPNEDFSSTQHTPDPQVKKEFLPEPSSTPLSTAGTSTLDSRWATSNDTYRSNQGLPATKFSESLAQRQADLHPEESNQPLTLVDVQEDRTAQDWRSNDNRTRGGYNSFGRSSYNRSSSSSHWDNSYQSRGSFQDRDSNASLSANAAPWYPDSPRRQQRQSTQQSYEPVTSRPWNMIAMKKKFPSPSSEASTDVDSLKTEGQKSWTESTSRPSWTEERKSSDWRTDNQKPSAMVGISTADEAWNEPIPKESNTPIAPVVSFKVTSNSVSPNPSTDDPVQSTSLSQLSLYDEPADNSATSNAAESSTGDWNPTSVPWSSEPKSPKPSLKNDQSTKRYTWSASEDQATETYNATQPYSITISLPSSSRSRPSESRNIRVSTPPSSQTAQNGHSATNNNTSTMTDNYLAQQEQEVWDPAKEPSWHTKPDPSATRFENSNAWNPTESPPGQTQERADIRQQQPANVESPRASWNSSEYQNRSASLESHHQAEVSPHKQEKNRTDNKEQVLPPSASCRPWDVDKYKHRLWEQ